MIQTEKKSLIRLAKAHTRHPNQKSVWAFFVLKASGGFSTGYKTDP
jgi:hypothetical protein